MSSISEPIDISYVEGMAGAKFGTFQFRAAERRWEWSDAVAHMHGYRPGDVSPTTELLLSHIHPDDAAARALLAAAFASGDQPFSSRHRIVDSTGIERRVVVIGDRFRDARGAPADTAGFYIDVTESDEHELHTAVEDIAAQRATIERAKGILMLTYGITAERAFEILSWRSQQTNTKLRALAAQFVGDAVASAEIPESLRDTVDHLLLTTHNRTTEGTS